MSNILPHKYLFKDIIEDLDKLYKGYMIRSTILKIIWDASILLITRIITLVPNTLPHMWIVLEIIYVTNIPNIMLK